MKNKKKLYLLVAGISAAVCLILFISSKIYFSVWYEEKKMQKFITGFFKENLDKAVKFEDSYINSFGDIVLSNFNLSMTSDFNDNISLVKSREAVLRLDFIELFKGKPVLKGIDFIESDVSVLKRYGKSYLDSFEQVIALKRKGSEIENIDLDNFVISFKKSSLYYNEIFKEKKLIVECNNISSKIRIKSEEIHYSVEGDIKPYKSKKIKESHFNLTGTVNLEEKGANNSRYWVNLENFDLSYLNDYIKEYELGTFSLLGGLSSAMEIQSNREGDMLVSGGIETNNLSMLSRIPVQYNLISNGNVNIEIDGSINVSGSRYSLKKLKIFDDIFQLVCSGEYNKNDKEEKLAFRFKTNTIQLADLSTYITPVQDMSYGGTLALNGDIDFDLKKGLAPKMALNAVLDNFYLNGYEKGVKKEVLRGGSVKLTAKGNTIDMEIQARPPESDFSIRSKTKIAQWVPLKSQTTVDIDSKKIKAGILFYIARGAVQNLFDSALADRRAGYEELFFLKRPEAQYLINNDLNLSITAKKVCFENKAALTDLKARLEMQEGDFSLREFSLHGYNATYMVQLLGYFNRDYPYFLFSGSINGFDIGSFLQDYNPGLSPDKKLEGTGAMEFDYKLNAYRLGHIFQNSQGNLSMYAGFTQGELNNSMLQRRVGKFLRENGHTAVDMTKVNVSNFSISFAQMGEHFYIRNFGIRSDRINYNSYGKYFFDKGLDMRIFTSFTDDGGRIVSLPLQVKGGLLSPELAIAKKRDSKKILLFNIN
ncbi:MAG: hypothetical protein GY754_02285 [bacterium]|nr:hypothetical protein [bacterium]